MTGFKSAYTTQLADYVKLRRGLGLRFDVQAAILRQFDRFLVAHAHEGAITQALALQFASANQEVSRAEQARRYQVVRHFNEYLATFSVGVPRLDPHALRAPVRPATPRILTEDELGLLVSAAKKASPTLPVRGPALQAMIGLAACTGLRIGEVLRLDRQDVDLENALLTIRRTKFAKDRLVPIHPTTREVLREYGLLRDAAFPTPSGPSFFLNTRGRRFAVPTLEWAMHDLGHRTGLRGSGKKGPRFHDLRHTFAVHRLVAWYRAGADVQAKLPLLATYMGHVGFQSTAYYLTATAELLGLAEERRRRFLEESGCTHE